jgi:hypothetical protein
MTRHWKATVAVVCAGVTMAVGASPAVANDGAKVKADTDPDASAKLHLDGGKPTMVKL